jgi:hypothetical protein
MKNWSRRRTICDISIAGLDTFCAHIHGSFHAFIVYIQFAYQQCQACTNGTHNQITEKVQGMKPQSKV